MEQIISEFLKQLKVPVSKRYVQYLIHSHPDFPTLLSISDTFQRLGIDHTVRRVSANDLRDLPYPFLLPIEKDGGTILLVNHKEDLTLNEKDLNLWSGVVLQAESRKQTID